ncbi:MAG: putative metal-dependent hydrolase [Siphonobacter sp.]
MEELRYPIGFFVYDGLYTPEQRKSLINTLYTIPQDYRKAVEGLSEDQLKIPYREGGWTIRQVVHHVADSHMNGYIRTKLALTEANPIIKPYEEARWAELGDTFVTPIEISLNLLEMLHIRWANLFASMQDADFTKMFVHPEAQKTYTLDMQLGNYVWHSRHHLAHITGLRQRMGW